VQSIPCWDSDTHACEPSQTKLINGAASELSWVDGMWLPEVALASTLASDAAGAVGENWPSDDDAFVPPLTRQVLVSVFLRRFGVQGRAK
jgi:hypothetical protein